MIIKKNPKNTILNKRFVGKQSRKNNGKGGGDRKGKGKQEREEREEKIEYIVKTRNQSSLLRQLERNNKRWSDSVREHRVGQSSSRPRLPVEIVEVQPSDVINFNKILTKLGLKTTDNDPFYLRQMNENLFDI